MTEKSVTSTKDLFPSQRLRNLLQVRSVALLGTMRTQLRVILLWKQDSIRTGLLSTCFTGSPVSPCTLTRGSAGLLLIAVIFFLICMANTLPLLLACPPSTSSRSISPYLSMHSASDLALLPSLGSLPELASAPALTPQASGGVKGRPRLPGSHLLDTHHM